MSSRTRSLVFVAAGCLLFALIWYWQAYLTYDGEVSHFEAKVRRQVVPADLQAWANSLLTRYPAYNATDTGVPIKSFPDYLQKLHPLPPSGYVFPATPDRQGYVSVMWGSGFRGAWGLHIGSTNYVDGYHASETWKPGVYFWRDYRR